MSAAAFILLALLATPGAGPRRYNQLDVKDMEAMAPVLKRHTAEILVKLTPNKDLLLESDERSGYGVVLEDDLVACLSAVVDGAASMVVLGPKHKPLAAKIVLLDPERRVALLRTQQPLADTGLYKVTLAPKKERKVDLQVFAPISTQDLSGVVFGVISDTGDQPEYEGHPRIDLLLTRGMPVFDDRARFVGYSRVVAWDQDRFMLITPEMIQSARTATGAAARRELAPPPKKPWWSK